MPPKRRQIPTRKKTARRVRRKDLWPGARRPRPWFRAFRAAPLNVQLVVGVVVVVALWFAVNGIYQVLRKPTELYFPVSGVLAKSPVQTWRKYEPIFREHATDVITSDLLAALAQIEGSGNPVARTYWRWYASWDPFELYRPASSAVGMYQITDGTFVEARRYCIRNHAVMTQGPWNDWRSCWFNSLYLRVVPTHAVELTSAMLDRRVAHTLERYRIVGATLQQKQELAAVIHLCGNGVGDGFAKRRFRVTEGQKCGDHDVARYLAKVDGMKRVFRDLAGRAGQQ